MTYFNDLKAFLQPLTQEVRLLHNGLLTKIQFNLELDELGGLEVHLSRARDYLLFEFAGSDEVSFKFKKRINGELKTISRTSKVSGFVHYQLTKGYVSDYKHGPSFYRSFSPVTLASKPYELADLILKFSIKEKSELPSNWF